MLPDGQAVGGVGDTTDHQHGVEGCVPVFKVGELAPDPKCVLGSSTSLMTRCCRIRGVAQVCRCWIRGVVGFLSMQNSWVARGVGLKLVQALGLLTLALFLR
jgi:hypothetical protein